VLLLPRQNRLRFYAKGREEASLNLPPEFDAQAFHLFRIEVNGLIAHLQIDRGSLQWEVGLAEAARTVALRTSQTSAAFAGFALTAGWEDTFLQHNSGPQDSGWQVRSGEWTVSRRQLQQVDPQSEALIIKQSPLMPLMASYELVINVRLVRANGIETYYGICLIQDENVNQTNGKSVSARAGLLLIIRQFEDAWFLAAEAGDSLRTFALPAGFDPNKYQQFRFRKEGTLLQLHLASQPLGEVECEFGMTLLGLVSRQAAVAFDMVRVTALTTP
jgi:hypothetical protein